MDRQDYISKANNLLSQSTYRSIPWDPTYTMKNKLISILKRVNNQTGLNNQTYIAMYTPGCISSKFYGLPKIHKLDSPLRAYCIKLWIHYFMVWPKNLLKS